MCVISDDAVRIWWGEGYKTCLPFLLLILLDFFRSFVLIW